MKGEVDRFHIEYHNGAEEDAPRCFLLETKGKDGSWNDARWLVQREPKGPAIVLTQAQVRRVVAKDKPDLVIDPYRRPRP